jgi:hypothetical protein
MLTTADGHRFPIKSGPRLDRAAMAWSYIARHRIRWQRSRFAREDLRERCVRQLARLGIDQEALDTIASCRLVEVTVPYTREEENWASRVMPWEYIISAAVGASSNAGLLVTRHLDRGRRRRRTGRAQRGALVLGATEALKDFYTFDTERTLPTQTLEIRTRLVEDPTLIELRRKMATLDPDIIHVGGVDLLQGQEFFDFSDEPLLHDGMILVNEARQPIPVSAHDVARALTAGKTRKPALVAFNLYNSAARLAALTVAEGADVAIGFQDKFDDLAAERFLGQLYRAWQVSGGDPLVSFAVGWSALRDSPDDLPGSGIVLWSASSLMNLAAAKLAAQTDAIERQLRDRRSRDAGFSSLRDAADTLAVSVRPIERLNYALLHNRQPMFDWFELRNQDEERRVSGVRVEVELFAGTERLPYSATLAVGDAPVSVSKQIFVPLTSTLVRSLRESIRASVNVRVSVGALEGVYENSYRVTLLPTDEWVDDDDSRQWLPSFVFPQDPAVEQIVAAARPYLTFLADSPSAGFDGYQAIDLDAEDPSVGVDAQVAAIWSALVHALPLSYINPPPTYTEESQRLRFPSRILGGRAGTCIDLALLMAACLEYVNIYPVVFLLEGHAFPGYWRSEESWDEFINMRNVEQLGIRQLDELAQKSGPVDQRYPWVFPAAFHTEIMTQIEQGHLVPLETVWLTTHAPIEEAEDTGWENLLKASEFNSLIDITMARECDVTPLPAERAG